MATDADRVLLLRAIELSREHSLAGVGGPFGAVVARDGVIVSEGWNRVLETLDPTAHAEIVAIRRATEALGRRSLEGCVIYSSCEPCPMCLGAIHWARLDALHFAATRDDAAELGFDDAFIYDELGRPTEGRRLPCIAHEREAARDAMRVWSSLPDRPLY